eukprot:6320902-Prymnesium_polylepis.1
MLAERLPRSYRSPQYGVRTYAPVLGGWRLRIAWRIQLAGCAFFVFFWVSFLRLEPVIRCATSSF